MSAAHPSNGATPAELAAVRERLAPVLERLAAGTIERDAARELPLAGVAELAAAGFGALRVPRSHGGAGLNLEQLFDVLVDVAAADPNAAQALRGHLAFVEDRLVARPGPARDAWLARFVAGELVGNAWTDAPAETVGGRTTTLRRADSGEGWALDGTKYYSTGSLFAQWIDVYAASPGHGEDVIALVRTDVGGVERFDDWDGFGQRGTGTGTTIFTGAPVRDEDVVPGSDRFGYQTAFYQQVLLATLAGIVRTAADEGASALRERVRGYSHGAAAGPAADPQLLQAIGEVDAAAFAARAVVRQAAASLDAAAAAHLARWGGRHAPRAGGRAEDGDTAPATAGTGTGPGVVGHRDVREAVAAANDAAELATGRGQVVLSVSVPAAAARLFDALGASGTSTSRSLDRHWRNARTVASHNPWVYKARDAGDALVNGKAPTRLWSVVAPVAAS